MPSKKKEPKVTKPETNCEISFPRVLSFSTSIAPDSTKDAVKFLFEVRNLDFTDPSELGDVYKRLDRGIQEFKEALVAYAKMVSVNANASQK
jgi:hypothetical protein